MATKTVKPDNEDVGVEESIKARITRNLGNMDGRYRKNTKGNKDSYCYSK